MSRLPLGLALAALLSLATHPANAQETPEDIRNRAVVLFSGSVEDKTAAVVALEQAAAAGDAPSMLLLGGIYLRGDGVEADRAAAVQWYYRAAREHQPGALEKLADLATETTAAPPALSSERASAAALREGGLVYWNDKDAGNDIEAVVYFRMAAEQGDARAFGLLGDAYFSGYGVTADVSTALGWYQHGAAAADTESMTTLAHLYRDGIGVDQDLDLAFRYARDAATAGSPLGLRYLGDMYRLGQGTPRRFAEARDNLEAAAAFGDTESLPLLGALYAAADGQWPADPTASFTAYKKAYDAGVGGVALPLAEDYRTGAGTPKNVAAAIEILTQATVNEKGYLAMAALGDIYLQGELGHIDTTRAAEWYRKATDIGYGPAQVKLADLYRRGAGVPQDLDYTRRLYKTALSNGEDVQRLIDALPDAEALKAETAFSRAQLLASGPLSPSDEKQLRTLYRTAAEKDDVPEAMVLLADMLSDGRGGDVSAKEAFTWRLRAAEAGVIDAMIAVGRDYEKGRGTAVSRDKALTFYQKASAQGSEAGTAEFERLTDMPVPMVVTAEAAEKAKGLVRKAATLASSAVDTDRAQALKLYAEAAGLGNTDAMLAYGERVAFDTAAPSKDRQRAFQWLAYAAKTGNVPAMGLIARAYAEGEAATKNLRAAARWYRRAVDGGDVPSLVPAAELYLNGRAAPASVEKGREWLDRALSLKLPGASLVAALAHLPKGGLPADDEAAAAFMVAALAEGDPNAVAALDRGKWQSYPEPFRKALQAGFTSLGVYDGPIDGRYGSRTAKAVERVAIARGGQHQARDRARS